MMPRLPLTILPLIAVLVVSVFEVAWSQTAPIQGLEKLTPEERAIAERNLERWQKLTPEERARALENYRRWKSMTPEERFGSARSSAALYESFRALPHKVTIFRISLSGIFRFRANWDRNFMD